MVRARRSFPIALIVVATLAAALPAAATTQLGAGLHYLRTLGEIKDSPEVDENGFALFGTVTIPLAAVRVEGNVEFVPDYLGSGEILIQPAAYGLVDVGMAYGGFGIGYGYLDGEWATNPFYALRAGIQVEQGGLSFDIFASYRFQSATYDDVSQNFDMDALTFAAQLKFGG